ncbi:hypothetical protein C5167_043895 [Papaver somniferum]|uniref:Protein kinase domain-containing protein n=1 Tax=Papaver somniferum TaxID=3469 RepID=A0A4Y7L704_PAPSO|nr:hypothetical protein C5167_043895 [Papaver somniferum]
MRRLPNIRPMRVPKLTRRHSRKNLIGKGGYAEVYKGCLQDGALVAVKRLNRATTEETVANFLAELGIIAHVNHPNTAKLMGYGVEGGMYIVLKFSHLGSLASILHAAKGESSTETSRLLIFCLPTTLNLRYAILGLQSGSRRSGHLTVSKFEGTVGYLAPEYFMHGVVDEKIDVFAFGVLLLELVTGRRALGSSQQNLLMWAKPLLDKKDSKELVDPSLGDQYDPHELNRVVQLLRNDATSLECIKQFQKPVLKRTYSEELLDAEEYNSTKYLRDLNRHRQIALET